MPSNLLLLDEPTNHLDIPAREAIEAFLAGTPATILVVSHDRRLLETICDRLWVVDDGLAVPFDGGYRAWRAAIADGWTPAAAAEAEAKRLHGGRAPGRWTAPGRRKAAARHAAGRRPTAPVPRSAGVAAPSRSRAGRASRRTPTAARRRPSRPS